MLLCRLTGRNRFLVRKIAQLKLTKIKEIIEVPNQFQLFSTAFPAAVQAMYEARLQVQTPPMIWSQFSPPSELIEHTTKPMTIIENQ